jgi:hypothetical protein
MRGHPDVAVMYIVYLLVLGVLIYLVTDGHSVLHAIGRLLGF